MNYLLLKMKTTSSKKSLIKINLPCIIGTDPLSDVFLTDGLATNEELLLRVSLEGNQLKLQNLKTSAPFEKSLLCKYGIDEISLERPQVNAAWQHSLRFQWSLLITCLVFIVFFGYFLGSLVKSDGFTTPVTLTPGAQLNQTFFSQPDEGLAYKKGVSFLVEVPESWKQHSVQLSFRVKGVQSSDSFAVLTNNATLFKREMDVKCLVEVCAFQVTIGKEIIKSGSTEIQFLNLSNSPDFGLASVSISSFPVAQIEQKKQINLFLDSAAEYYANQHLAKPNLGKSRMAILNAMDLNTKFHFGKPLRDRISSLRKDIFTELANTFDKRKLSAEAAIRMGDLNLAREEIKDLKSLFPDDTSSRGRTVLALDQSLKEMRVVK